MFTDGPTTPRRVETLIELLRGVGGALERDTVLAMLEPDGLPDKASGTSGAAQTLRAAKELGLIRHDARVTLAFRSPATTREVLVEALDREVLCKPEPEPYFALFYAYVLGVGVEAAVRVGNDRGARNPTNPQWATAFNRDVFDDRLPTNPFNKDKISGLNRWLSYAGLGWFDPSGAFQCNPYERLRRRLAAVFGKDTELEDDEFMLRLGAECPELDGGEIFQRANRGYDPGQKRCTLGLAHALVELHLDGVVRLHCGDDSSGWSLAAAEPPVTGSVRSDRMDFIEYPAPTQDGAR